MLQCPSCPQPPWVNQSLVLRCCKCTKQRFERCVNTAECCLWQPWWQNRARHQHYVHILILKPACMINTCTFLNLTKSLAIALCSLRLMRISQLVMSCPEVLGENREWKSDMSNGLLPAMTTEADCKIYYFTIDKYLEQIQINSCDSLNNPRTLQLL